MPNPSPPPKGHQSCSGKYWIRMGFRDWLGFGELEQFGRMENANWVILGFRFQKCNQFFHGTRNDDFGASKPQSTPFVTTTGTGYGYIHFLSTLRIHSQEGGSYSAALPMTNVQGRLRVQQPDHRLCRGAVRCCLRAHLHCGNLEGNASACDQIPPIAFVSVLAGALL